MAERLVTIATFSKPHQAHRARTKLESEGVKCFVADEHMVRMIWIYSVFVGGVKLPAKESDAERAKGFLAEVPKGAEWAQEQEASLAEPQIHCPSGGSGNVILKGSVAGYPSPVGFLVFPYAFPRKDGVAGTAATNGKKPSSAVRRDQSKCLGFGARN